MIETVGWWFVRRGRSPRAVAAARVGAFGEWVACRYYRRCGFRILGRNRRIAGVEIDLLVRSRRDGILVLVEVKTSTNGISGLRRIDRNQCRRLSRAAERLGGFGSVELHAADVDVSEPRPRVRSVTISPLDRISLRPTGRGSGPRRS